MALTLDVILSREKIQEIIAKRITKEFNPNEIVTLGIGLPAAAINYIPKDMNLTLFSASGILGLKSIGEYSYSDKKIVDSTGTCSQIKKGGSFFDTQMACTIARSGHIDVCVLGALQIDEEGNLANWQIPNKFMPGIGDSLDLIMGSKRVIVAMEHTSHGIIKIVKKCNLPLTARNVIDTVITERCVFKFIEGEMTLVEINPMYSINDIRTSSLADFKVSSDLKIMEVN